MKTLIHPVTGQQFKMGRKLPAVVHSHMMRHMMEANVLPKVTVPASTNYSSKAATALHEMYKNDTLGDCVIAGGFHVRGETSYNSGQGVLFSDTQVIHDYSAIGGYDPSKTAPDGSNPTDQGCDENTALNYWTNTGFPDGVKLIKAVSIDATNIAEVRMALYLFENIYFGVALPDAWVNPFPSGPNFRWDVAGAPDQNNGHCFVGCDLVPNGVKISTWGMCGYLTNAAISYYAANAQGGQLFTLLSEDIINRVSQKSPAGYDIKTLTSYIAQI